ncbi:MAG: hypothetical protein WC254_01530 [Candidatus Woesearchaeota archaeon]|jgi:uncharacterized protein (TIGR00290 family)
MLREVKPKKIRLGAMFNGDKESICALHIATAFDWDIACLMTIQNTSDVNNITQYQAQAMKLPLIIEQSSGESLADMYEAIKKAKEQYQITGIIAAGSYETLNKICKELQIRMFAPLWKKDQTQLLKEMIEYGMEIQVCEVTAESLGEQWLGRKIDMKAYNELVQLQYKIGFNPAGESGEYKSIVLYCPHLFQKKLIVKKAEKHMESECKGRYTIQEVAVA